MATATKSRKIKPAEWCVVGQLRHDGITYGMNEPLPEMTLDQAEAYVVQGMLVRRGDVVKAQAFLDVSDGMVLQRVLDDAPSAEFLEELVVMAQRTSRSRVLELALTIAAKGAARSAARSPR